MNAATTPTAVVTLHQAELADAAQLLPMVQAYHRFEQLDDTGIDVQAAFAPLLGDSQLGRIWLIRVDANTVGYVAITFGYSIEFAGLDAFIDEFFIDESQRGKGVGKLALNRLAELAAELHVRAIHLEVARDNSRAQSLYRSAGFEMRAKYVLMSRDLASLNSVEIGDGTGKEQDSSD